MDSENLFLISKVSRSADLDISAHVQALSTDLLTCVKALNREKQLKTLQPFLSERISEAIHKGLTSTTESGIDLTPEQNSTLRDVILRQITTDTGFTLRNRLPRRAVNDLRQSIDALNDKVLQAQAAGKQEYCSVCGPAYVGRSTITRKNERSIDDDTDHSDDCDSIPTDWEI